MTSQTDQKEAPLRRRVYEIIEVGRGVDNASSILDTSLIVLIILNTLAFALETVPSIEQAYGDWLYAFEVFSVLVFTVEYILRIWTAVEVPFLQRMPAWKARLLFARRPYLIIDLLAVLPFYLSFLVAIDLRVLRVLRLLRFLKLSRYSPAMHTLVRVLYNERRSLMGAGMLLIAAVLFAATGMYYLEHLAQPDKFGSIPESAYWAVTTLTTVGYGDAAPITPLGKMFATLVMVVGLCVLALPVAIVSTGFAQEVGRHDFVVTWSLMSRIPLFASLDANDVAKIMPLLHAHNLPQNVEVISRDTVASGMYFVASGVVDCVHDDGTTSFGTGEYFGIVSILQGLPAPGDYRTRSRCRLLKLHSQDFAQLERANPEIAGHIRRVAAERFAQREAATENATEVD